MEKTKFTLLYYTTGLTAAEKVALRKYVVFTNFGIHKTQIIANWVEISLKRLNSLDELEACLYLSNQANFKLILTYVRYNNMLISFFNFKNWFLNSNNSRELVLKATKKLISPCFYTNNSNNTYLVTIYLKNIYILIKNYYTK